MSSSQQEQEVQTQEEQQKSAFVKGFLRFLSIVLIAVVVYAAVKFMADRQMFSRSTPTPNDAVTVVSPAPQPLSLNGSEIIYQDNFETSQGTWELSPAHQAEYAAGAIILTDNHYDQIGWARPHLKFDNFMLDVDCRWLGGSIGGEYGLQFRLQDEINAYAFTIRNDGWYVVAKNIEGEWRTLAEAFSSAINRSGDVNHLHIEANGQNLRFFVNNVYLTDVSSVDPSAGDIMFTAVKVDGTDQMQVGFDNLVVAFYPSGT
ncbi:MAG: DUF1080 domain-containing protein [Chloroflexi bacterium]|nr:DUF1080 domain-containing protein [Chloroflexota bacterium]